MRHYNWMLVGIVLAVALMIVGHSGVKAVAGDAALTVVPDKTALSPELIKQPVQFKGTGFEPGETAVVEMVLPKGVTVKTVAEGENVGLAFGDVDDKGAFVAKMAPTATLNWFFQTEWTKDMKPNLKEATPLPPGTYEIVATGMPSGKTAKATLEILKPAPKTEK